MIQIHMVLEKVLSFQNTSKLVKIVNEKKGSNIKKKISRYLKVKFSIRILRVFNQLLLE